MRYLTVIIRILFIMLLLFSLVGIIPVDIQETKAAIGVTSLGTDSTGGGTGTSVTVDLTSGVTEDYHYIVGFAGDVAPDYARLYYGAASYTDMVADSYATNAGSAYSAIFRCAAEQDLSWGGTYPYLIIYDAVAQSMAMTAYEVTGITDSISVEDQTDGIGYQALRNGAITRAAERITFYPCTITSVDFKLSKNGAPTGDCYARVRDSGTDTIIGTIGSIDVTTIGAVADYYTFTGGSAVISSETDARICIEYSGGDVSNNIRAIYDSSDITSVGIRSTYSGSWTDDSGGDMTWQNMTGALIPWILDKTNQNTGSGTDASTNSSGILDQDDEIVFACTAVEDEYDDGHGTWTAGSGYVSGNEQFDATNFNGDGANQQVHTVARIVTDGTSQAYEGVDAGHDSIDWAACIATYMMAPEGGTPSLTNTPSPSSKDFGNVLEETTYYCYGTAPNNPVEVGDCTWTITNDGSIAIDINMKSTNMIGATTNWTLTSGTPSTNEVKITAYYVGQNPASGLVLTTSDQLFYNSLSASANISWDFSMLTGVFTEGEEKTGTITLTAVAD